MSCLKGRVAIVTGGGSGIGLAIAKNLAGESVRLALVGRDAQKLERAAKEVSAVAEESSFVIARPGDVSRVPDVTAVVDEVLAAWGRVDILVNNAGISVGGPIEKITEAEWDQVLDVNLKGAFLFTRAVLPIMKRQNRGYIINIGSVAGVTGSGGLAAYSASKFGMVGFTQALAEELDGYPIRTTAICPGYVATPMVAEVGVPPGEMIQPDEIGKTVNYLLHLRERVVIKQIVIERKGAE